MVCIEYEIVLPHSDHPNGLNVKVHSAIQAFNYMYTVHILFSQQY